MIFIKKLLLIIDYQNDFVTNEGSLTAGEPAQAIEANLLARIATFTAAGDDVLCTLDTHTAKAWNEKHPESLLFPLHCTEDSAGWQLAGKLASLNLETLKKASYMLEVTDIDWLVRQYDLVELAGVATDICVLQNAVGLYNHAANHNLKVNFQISSNCVASFDPAGHAFALDYMHRILGFTVI